MDRTVLPACQEMAAAGAGRAGRRDGGAAGRAAGLCGRAAGVAGPRRCSLPSTPPSTTTQVGARGGTSAA